MKKNKTIITIIVFIMCVILVSIVFMRVKAVEENNLNEDNLVQETELRKEIANIKNKYEMIMQTLEDTSQKIEDYQEQIERNEDSSELVTKELKETNALSGKTGVRGEGVVITLEDNEDDKVFAVDLSELINELKYAGAEAISINGIRITSMTDITDATNSLILINGQRITGPYEVKAIGNQTDLYSTLSTKNGFIDFYSSQYRIIINIKKQTNIVIDKTSQDTKLKYIKEGED